MAVALLAGCGARDPAVGLFPGAEEYADEEVEEIEYVNTEPFAADTLAGLVATSPPSCAFLALPPCIPGTEIGEKEHPLSLEVLRRDVARLALFYRRSGFYETEVDVEIEPVGGDDDGVVVTFVIERGEPIILDSVAVEGTEGILDPDSVTRRLPLTAGERFDVSEFDATADTLRQLLLRRGYIEAQVLANYTINTRLDRASARYVAVPGPQVTVDTILIFGADDLGREGALQQITISEGELLTPAALVESQRNLYGLDLVQFAAVEVAADSLQLTAEDSTTATVAIRITEAPVHVVEALVGYGTVECFRTRVQWVSRSFGGGATRLELSGALSKIGIGPPANLDQSVCGAYQDDAFGASLDYHVAATLTEPGLLNPGNRLALELFAERQSEPNIFQRQALGGRLSTTQVLGNGDRASATLTVERRRTRASNAIFCALFRVCAFEDIRRLNPEEPRWENSIAVRYRRDELGGRFARGDGYRLDGGVKWAARWLGSEVDFLRGVGEATVHRSIREDWVLAGRVRLGTFLSPDELGGGTSFLPPDDRFFAGGAASVRGFRRNRLGPGVYVAEGSSVSLPVDPDSVNAFFVPSGGTALAVLNAELRIPAFFSPETFRLAFFIDAGALGDDALWNLDLDAFRITPGFGIRLETPVGPARLDIAYNPYGPPAGDLLVPRNGKLLRVIEAYDPDEGSFFEHFRLHLAVGQPF